MFSLLLPGLLLPGLLLPGLLLPALAASSPGHARRRPLPPAAAGPDTAAARLPARYASVQQLPLRGPLSKADAEVSGLAWHGDTLLLLPQYPFRMSGSDDYGLLFALTRRQVEASLKAAREGRSPAPLAPRPVPLLAPALKRPATTYEGFEALAFEGHRAFVSIETVGNPATGAMSGLLLTGCFDGDTLRLGTRRTGRLPTQTSAGNMAYEALLTPPQQGVVALYEANGRNVNPHPRAAAFASRLHPRGTLPFPALEYRLTDATALDGDGRFWVINYFFPGERDTLDPAPDPLSAPHGTAPDYVLPVERLVEFRWSDAGLQRTSTPPLFLTLLDDHTPRNWEGLVRFRSEARGAGFLLVTDRYPRTMLDFVAANERGGS